MPDSRCVDSFSSAKTSNNKDVFAIGTSNGGQGSNATVASYYVKTSDEVLPVGPGGSATNVTDLRFTPQPNKTYLVEAWVYTTTSLTTNTIAWAIIPTVSADISEMVKMSYIPTSATVWSIANRNDTTGVSNSGVGSLLDADQYGWALLKTAGSISGTIGFGALVSTAGQTFTIKAGSFIRVREVA